MDDESPAVTLRDTGLLHGAGLFTTMKAVGGRVFLLDRHLARLRQSSQALFVPLPYSDADLADAIDQTLARNGLSDARLRLTLTRGQQIIDPVQGVHLAPNCFITAAELTPYPARYYAAGMTVVVNDEQKLNPYDLQAGHKTLDYFSRLAAMRLAAKTSAGESLWFNVHNYLQSGSISNIFLLVDGALTTPPTRDDINRSPASYPYPRSNVLPGIMRSAVLEGAAEMGLAVETAAVTLETLLKAREVFLTNSIMEVMPVSHIEQHAVGEGRPGPLTRQLMEWIAARR